MANSLCEFIKTWHKSKLVVGTDDHGTKIRASSKALKAKPTKLSNLNANKILAMCSKHKINVKDWISTSWSRHIKSAKHKIAQVKNHNMLYKLSYCGWYSPNLDCYHRPKEVKYCANLMYCVNNAPTEWVEEQGYFVSFSKAKLKLVAIQRAKLIVGNTIRSLSLIKSSEDVCITRQGSTNYGIRITTQASRFVLWVWIDALWAYVNNHRKNKIYVVGKDVANFFLTHYTVLSLCASDKLAKAIFQHAHVRDDRAKLSKSLRNSLIAKTLPNYLLSYWFCSKSPRSDMKLNDSETEKTANELANNVGNLAKRITKLAAMRRPSLGRLTTNEWVVIAYLKQLANVLMHMIKGLEIDKAIKTVFKNIALINKLTSSYKLWNRSSGHKLFVYTFATKQLVLWLKPIIGGKSNEILSNIAKTNFGYTPFPKPLTKAQPALA
ncbi:MAG: class I tRNA ligase family protein [Candidatus Hodgkinia cicadicola]|nr:MAG: class I tRNA ligase family protein [Candidatus Hodgkinia cicadicola]